MADFPRRLFVEGPDFTSSIRQRELAAPGTLPPRLSSPEPTGLVTPLFVAGPGAVARGAPQVTNNTTVNVPPAAPAPQPRTGVMGPQNAEERALVSQGGWAGASEAVAPLLGDWRTTPLQVISTALAGYNRGTYGAQQDLAANRRAQAELEAAQADAKMKQAAWDQSQKRQQATLDYINKQPPEVRDELLAAYNIDPSKAAEIISPAPISATDQAKLDLQRELGEQGNALQQAQLEQTGAYQRGMLAVQQRQNEIEAAKTRSAPAPDLVAVDDPDKPGQSKYVDKRTGQDFMVGGQVARPSSPREAGAAFNQGNTLRTAYLKQVKDAQDSAVAYRKIDNAFRENTGAGDIAGIFGFMKAIDPTSTVREGEFATAENSGGITERIRNLYNKALEGERLTPKVRGEILSAAASQVNAYRPAYEQARTNYQQLAADAGLAPDSVVQPFDFPDLSAGKFAPLSAPQPGGQAGPTMAAAASTSPPQAAPVATAAHDPEYTAMFGLP